VVHEGGSVSTAVNQNNNGGQWRLFGSAVTLAPGEGHRLELPGNGTNNYVVADAARFTPAAGARRATWAISVGATGSYRVYARWPASNSHATDAPYTVTHAGGSTTVTVNQRVNGGQWNLLGTFAFDQGASGYQVELTDDAASGRVAADAIYYVADSAITDAFTWSPAIPGSGVYQVYARWPASSANTGAAQYTVTHAGGTAEVTLSQKQNGGAWVPLGNWSFAPGAGHKVTLAAAAEGTTIADAMLFVGAGAQPANLLYVHADHLGSPQKLTDASQATVWDGVFDPFGEEIAITGLAAMPMRFPGQYADEETGYSYNYFRDYEPRLGRYLQADPIGLAGGVNLYAYVDSNPIGYIDLYGQQSCQAGEADKCAKQSKRAKGRAKAIIYLLCRLGFSFVPDNDPSGPPGRDVVPERQPPPPKSAPPPKDPQGPRPDFWPEGEPWPWPPQVTKDRCCS
jgi:RHS repeat-associated protein